MHENGALLLDRDGVINEMVHGTESGTVDSPMEPSEVSLLPGAAELICAANSHGVPVAVVSNQPGLAKQKFSSEDLDAVTSEILLGLKEFGAQVDGVFYCLHHPNGVVRSLAIECGCRKPAPGLLLRACREFGRDPRQTVMVGDRVTDVVAGRAAGARTVLVGEIDGLIQRQLERYDVWPDAVIPDVAFARDLLFAKLETEGQCVRGMDRRPGGEHS